MSAHTQGPWAVRDIPTGQRYIGPSQDGGAPSVALVLARVNVPDERLAADARLIAAAPELLEALQRLSAQCERMRMLGQSQSNAERNAAAVLAKATGEQQ
jgi:hypothetical protein